MISTGIIVLVIVAIAIAGYIVYRKTLTGREISEVSQQSEVNNFIDVTVSEGKSLIYLDRGEWKISRSSRKLPEGSDYLLTDLSPITSQVEPILKCENGIGMKSVVRYSVIYDTESIDVDTISMTTDSLTTIIDNIICSEVEKSIYVSSKELYENFTKIKTDIELSISSQLSNMGLILMSLSIDLNRYNSKMIEDMYKEVGDIPVLTEVDIARKKANTDVTLAEIESEKSVKLNEIKLEKLKKDNEFELAYKELENEKLNKLKSADITREIKLRKSKDDAEHEAELKAENDRLKIEKTKHENNIKIAEMKSEERIKLAILEKQSRTSEIEKDEMIEMRKIESADILSKRKHESTLIDIQNSKEEEISQMNSDNEVQKKKYELESSLYYETKASKERELELSVKIPTEYEAEKNELLAKSKASIKKIDTDSSIESSKSKLAFKKEESETISDIKKSQNINDSEVYERMMTISGKNENLAIQWKLIDTYEKIAQIQSEAITKMNLGQITINGGSGDEIGKYIRSLMPILDQIKLPEISKTDNE